MNTTLSDSVKDMSTTLGELQAKEEQLKTLIQHKVLLKVYQNNSCMSFHYVTFLKIIPSNYMYY